MIDSVNKFLREILQQPYALRNTLSFYMEEEGKEILAKISKQYWDRQFNHIIFTGMGSSFFTSYVASCLLSEYGIRSYVVNASELLHYNFSILRRDTLLVCVSQSGESFEIVRILQELPNDVTCWGITNEPFSTLAQKISEVLLSKAGPEEMTSTKTFVSTALVILILSWSLSGQWNTIKAGEASWIIDGVENMLQTRETWISPIMDFLSDFTFLEIIGRGPSYSLALQGALMFKEALRIPAEGILGGEFRHGPMEMVQKGFKAVVFAPVGKTYKQSIKMASDIIKFGGKVILITNKEIHLTGKNIHVIMLPKTDEYLFSIPGIVPLQLTVDQWAKKRGIEPGRFTRGAKVTTIE